MNLPGRLLLQRVPDTSGSKDQAPEDETPWLPYLVAVPVAALGGILVYAWRDWDMLAVATLVAGGAFVVGGLLGFLFGIPRSLAGPEGAGDDAAAAGAYRPNTNLEQISDWLTKILVGVGLVQFATLARHAGDLVNFLGPALGGEPLGESFAAATLVIFSISGFLAFYLVTRIYLGRAFAHADRVMVMSVVKKEIAQVQQTQRAQDERDVDALALVGRQLDPEPGAPPIPQEDLDAAVAAASPLVKTQIFSRARDQRRQTWKTDKASMERTIPVFRALTAAETDRKFHQNRAQLGYALKDKAQPDLPAAEAALTEAIDLRDSEGDLGFLLYEFNRALARILRHGTSPPAEVRAAIEADLKAADASRFLRRQIAVNPDIAAFRAAAPPTP
jgi:hypothetical protein